MATYGQYDTAYKPSGALGAFYSGQNAANLEQQNQLATIADIFDQRQKDLTYRSGEFKLGEEQYAAPNQRAVSDLTGANANYMLDPTRVAQMNQGLLGEAQSKVAAGTYDTAVLPSKTTAGIASNESGASESKYKQLATTLSTLDSIATGQGNMAAVQYVMQNFKDPQQRDTYLGLIRDGQLPTLVEHMALNAPSQIQKREDLTIQGKTQRDVAAINARSYEYSANKNYEAAVAAAEKGQLATAIAAAKYSADAYKAAFDEVQTNLDMYRKEDQQKPEYKLLLKKKDALRDQMTEAANLLVKMSKEPMREITTPTGKGASGSSSTTITSKQANPPAKMVITDEMLATGPQAATTQPVAPPPPAGKYRVVMTMGGDQAMVMLNNGQTEVRSLKQLQSYGFKPE